MQPIWNYIPHWMFQILEKKSCHKCNKKIHKSEICAMGIRNFDKTKATFYVEHVCSECETRAITSFGGQYASTIEDLAYIMIEQQQQQRKMMKSLGIESAQKSDRGKIQDGEVKDFLKFMNETKSYSELLKRLKIEDTNED